MTKLSFKEKDLSKGQLRKLKALRKSIGDDLANEAFGKWLAQQDNGAVIEDPNIDLMTEALTPLMDGGMRFPRGAHYQVKRGRKRFIVERVDQ